MLFRHVHEVLDVIEADTKIQSRSAAFEALRQLGVGDFGAVLWQMPQPQYPKLARLLPSAPSPEVQMSWTGQSGELLLLQSMGFVRSLAQTYSDLTGKSLAGKRIVDFGCGYGRFLRLMSYYSDTIWGVDPWQLSLDHCISGGLTTNIALSEYIPSELPIPRDMDMAFAFSVFTHLGPKTARASLRALRHHVADGGILCLTIRPIEYWRMLFGAKSEAWLSEKERKHQNEGFAFEPHNRPLIDGEVTYGDASMTLDWLAGSAVGWTICGMDRSGDDPAQRYVFLRAI